MACGLPDVQMTSVAGEGGTEGMPCWRRRTGFEVAQALGGRQRLVTLARLEQVCTQAADASVLDARMLATRAGS